MADTWVTTSRNQETVISDHGPGFDTVWKVKYKVTDGPARGTVGEVTVPVDEYNAATVERMIADEVRKHQEVASL